MIKTTPAPFTNSQSLASSSIEIRVFLVAKISKRTSNSELAEHFDRFGEVVDFRVISHDVQGTSAGYGSLRMKFQSQIQQQQMLQASHFLNGKKLVVQEMMKKKIEIFKTKKSKSIETVFFVFNIPPKATDDLLHSYFSRFGDIKCLVVQKEQYTNAHRGFCRLIYQQASSADVFMNQQSHTIDNYSLQVKTYEATKKQMKPVKNLIEENTGIKRSSKGDQKPSSQETDESDSSSTCSTDSNQNKIIDSTTTKLETKDAQLLTRQINQEPTQKYLEDSLYINLSDNDSKNINQFSNPCLLIAKERQVLGGFFNFKTSNNLDAIFKSKKSLQLLKSVYRRKVEMGSKHLPIVRPKA